MSGRNLDAFRHALERLDRADYLDDGYYGRWLSASELMLTDSCHPGAGCDQRPRAQPARRGRCGTTVPEPARPDYAPAAKGSLRTVDFAPAFSVGDPVRAKNMSPPGHTRLPGYVRGHTGVVELIQPAAVLPDTNADFQGENPQYVYSVRFDSRELWGAAAEPFAVTAELFESYLETTS